MIDDRNGRETLTLRDGRGELVVRPDLGAGLERYDFDGLEVFRTVPPGTAEPFKLANILLVPWSNRVSGGGFSFAGRFHALPLNHPGEAYPIHGNGYASAWTVRDQTRESVTLGLESEGPGPYRYAAEAGYALSAGALDMRLRVENRGAEPLPFGLGFHPWLPRGLDTTLQATATAVQLLDESYMPTGVAPVEDHPDKDYRHAKTLPAGLIANAFDGWDGRARVVWPDRRLALAIEADLATPMFILYSPSEDSGFFCFEPVSHLIDAHNAPSQPGLTVLAPGESLSSRCRFLPQAL